MSTDPNVNSAETAAQSHRKSIAEWLKAVPLGGRVLALIHQGWGWGGLIWLFIGLSIALSFTYFGLLPTWMVSSTYSGAASPQIRIVPTHLEKFVVSTPPKWMAYLRHWLEQEGDKLKATGAISGYMVNQIETQTLRAARSFEWALRPSSGFELNAVAFRTDKLHRLEALEDRSDAADKSIVFVVPEGDDGSKLVALIRIQWKSGQQVGGFLTTFHSEVK